MIVTTQVTEPVKLPLVKLIVELSLDEAVGLQRTVTALSRDYEFMRYKDRLYDALTKELQSLKNLGYDVSGAIYLR